MFVCHDFTDNGIEDLTDDGIGEERRPFVVGIVKLASLHLKPYSSHEWIPPILYSIYIFLRSKNYKNPKI